MGFYEKRDEFLNVAKCAVKEAGALQREYFNKALTVDHEFKHDLKLKIDRESEKIIIRHIKENFPDHNIISEESGVFDGKSEYTWIIDPLDGSVNYFYELPYYCVCVACYKMSKTNIDQIKSNQRPEELGVGLLGVVYQPATDTLYHATQTAGAFRNGTQIRVANYNNISECLVLLTTGGEPKVIEKMTRMIRKFSDKARKVRVFGATGLDIVNIASGGAGIFFQYGPHLWDFAASKVILEEAGGYFASEYIANGRFEVLACVNNSEIINEVIKIVREQVL